MASNNTSGPLYNNIGALQEWALANSTAVKRFPTAEEIQQRIVETRELLDHLQEVHALLEAHPQLERLVGALGKLQQL